MWRKLEGEELLLTHEQRVVAPAESVPLGVCVCVPAHGVKLLEELIHSGMVIITLSSHQIQSSAVLRADLLEQVV